jgi:hypothetical protein
MPTIIPEPGQEQEVARRLLAQADDPNDVATDTQGSSLGFRVSDEVAAAAGFGEANAEPGDEDTDDAAEGGVEEPPRAGAGSGEDVWREFLKNQDPPIEAPDDANRTQLIALWDDRDK